MARLNNDYRRNIINNSPSSLNRTLEDPEAPKAIIDLTTKDKFSNFKTNLSRQKKLTWSGLCIAVVSILFLVCYIGYATESQR